MISGMTNSITIIASQKRKALEESIERKRKILEDLMADYEMLKVELDLIKHEYHVRIGKLLLKDNQLDLEILQLKNLQELMGKGMTYKKALATEQDSFYSEILKMQKEQEKINEEQEMLDSIADVSEEIAQNIKEVWKRLIRKFHPDLAQSKEEKEKREEIMKKINKAYTENNLDLLKEYETSTSLENVKEIPSQELEEVLANIEEMIRNYTGEIRVLKASSWYEWKKKIDKAKEKSTDLKVSANKAKEDVFKELENNLLDDIVKKIEVVQKLREDVIPPGEEFFI